MKLQKRGYTEIEIGGKLIAFYFGIYTMSLYMELQGIESLADVEGSINKNPLIALPILFYSAHVAACYLNDKENEYQKQNAFFWIDEMKKEDINKLVLLWTSTLSKFNEEETPADKKKAGTKKKSL